jgi:CysZ protein
MIKMHRPTSIISSPALIIEGLKLLGHRDIRWLVIIPLSINIALFASATGFAAQLLGQWLDSVINVTPDWLHWLVWIIWGLFILVALVIYAFTFALVANLIGAPFYGLIAEKIMLLMGAKVLSNEAVPLLKIAWASFVRQLQLMAYLIPRAIVVGLACLGLSFIPLMNILIPVVAGSWAAWSLALQYLDYAADIDQVNFRQLRQRATAERWQSMSFGLCALAGSAIPVLNLLLMPATVIGGTLLWIRSNGLISADKPMTSKNLSLP